MTATNAVAGRAMVLPAMLILLTANLLVAQNTAPHETEGLASWYGGKFQGRLTASGEVFDTNELTAAHKTLPFGTVVEVTHLASGRTVRVRINDRGPFVASRIIDLSRAAAESLGMTGEGVAEVRLQIVSQPEAPVRTIQIGSFSDIQNAREVSVRLAEFGLPVSIESAESAAGVTVFRVVIPEVKEAELDHVLQRLESAGFSSVLVRSR
jgi:rare lipoprotein A